MLGHQQQIDEMFLTRRELLNRAGVGFASMGLATIMAEQGVLAAQSGGTGRSLSPMVPKAPHFPAKAKRVIHIFMNGGPSHVDTFDPKPALDKYHGKPLPIKHLKTECKTGHVFRSPF